MRGSNPTNSITSFFEATNYQNRGKSVCYRAVHYTLCWVAGCLGEIFGVVRVSTVFEFYMALYNHLKLDKCFETIKEKYKKSPTAAKNFEVYFVAADHHADAFAWKTPLVHMRMYTYIILDRTRMWNASALPDSINVYEVAGVAHEKQNDKTGASYNIWMKFLPSP